jgi:divalent metal cation (Fe/Co/Zn/Cd) transporter
LIGESADKADLQVIARLVNETKGVVSMMNMRSMQLGNDEFLVTVKIQWEPELLIGEVSARTNELEDRIRTTSPWARYIIIEPDVYDPVKAATQRV